MEKEHFYSLQIQWTGNKGQGTSGYRSYGRSHSVSAPGKPTILASSDPAFLGDPGRYNPEELLLASLSSCHMLWFLHLCSAKGISVTEYTDEPHGILREDPSGGGRFREVMLRPCVTVTDKDSLQELEEVHGEANRLCFIANSVNFPVKHQASGKAL